MPDWDCGIAGCGARFSRAEDLIRHQALDHEGRECAVCGRRLPAGYLGIQHVFDAHTRADYMESYHATAEDARIREKLKARIEERVDVPALVRGLFDRLELDPDDPARTRKPLP